MTLATVSPDNIVAALERGRKALTECRDDFDRLQVRDQAAAAVAAARILERRDIQNSAQWLMLRAEKVMGEANPTKQGERTDLTCNSGVISSPLTPVQRQRYRDVHNSITYDELDAAEQASIASPKRSPRRPVPSW